MTSPTNLSARLGMILLISVMMIAPIQSYCKLRCKSEFVEDCEICHTVHVRDCTIQMKSVLVPVKIRKCSPPKLTSFDGLECVNGSRTRCKVRFETKCGYHTEYREVVEDHPECRTEQVQSCPDDNREEITNFVNVDRKCVKVDVTRCNIVKKTLRKAKPVHQCKRVPKKACIKYPCDESDRRECRVTVKMQREERPKESCDLSPRRICQQQSGTSCTSWKLRRVCRCENLLSSNTNVTMP